MAPFQKGMQHSIHAPEDDDSPSSFVQGDQPTNEPTSTTQAPSTWTSPQDPSNRWDENQVSQQNDSWNQVPTFSDKIELQSDEPTYQRSRNGDKIYNSASKFSAQSRPAPTSSVPQKNSENVIQGQDQSSQRQDTQANTESGTGTPPVDESNKALPPHPRQPRGRVTQSGGMFATQSQGEPQGIFTYEKSGTYSRAHGMHATHQLSDRTQSQDRSSDAGTSAAQAPMSDKRRGKQRQRDPEEHFGQGNWGAMVAANGGPVSKSERAESRAWIETTADNTTVNTQGDGQGNGASHSNIDPARASEPQEPSANLDPQQAQTLGGSQAAPIPPPPSSVPETYLGLRAIRATVQVLQETLESGDASEQGPDDSIPATDAGILSALTKVFDARNELERLLREVKAALEGCRERERRLLEGRSRGGQGREG